MALKNLFDYNWWSKFFYKEKAQPLLLNTLPTVEPLGPPLEKLFYIDFSYPTTLNEVTKPEEVKDSPICSGTSTHESVLVFEEEYE